MTSTHTRTRELRVDLSRERILIGPDDPLPRFHPRPKAVMVIPIYHDSEVAQYPTVTDHRMLTSGEIMQSKSSPAQESRPGRPQRRRFGLFRRASSYSPPQKPPGHHLRDHSVPPARFAPEPYSLSVPSAGRSSSKHRRPSDASAYSPTSPYGMDDASNRARPPADPLSYNPPGYQVDAMQGRVGHSAIHARHPSSPYGPNDRARPPDDPIAQNTPEYQLQATQPQPNAQVGAGGIVGAPATTSAMGQAAPSQGHYGSSRPSGNGTHHSSSLGQKTLPLAGALSQGTSHGQSFDDAIQRYYKVLPPHPQWCSSRCRGDKKAVCIGINYVGQRSELNGCGNDARHMRDFIVRQHGFSASNILLLTDDDRRNIMPTREEIFKAIIWLVQGAKKDDSLFFHYSGHGGQSPDDSGREIDNMDETIFPVDFDEAGDIIDDELYQSLVAHLPPGCRLTAVFDSCHSGTVLDLPYLHSAHGRLRSIRHISRRARNRGTGPSADVICFSACKDDETSTDTFKGGVAVGAMSHTLIRTLKERPQQTYNELLAHLRELLIPQYDQKAQISSSHPVDMSQAFTI